MANTLVAVLSSQAPSSSSATSERLVPSWADEVLTPEQFFLPASDSSATWTGERRLLLAVLQDAVAFFFRYRLSQTVRGRRLFRETVQWFLSTDRSWLYSFENICAHLGLDADYMRLGLKRIQGGVLQLEPLLPQRRRQRRSVYLTLMPDVEKQAA